MADTKRPQHPSKPLELKDFPRDYAIITEGKLEHYSAFKRTESSQRFLEGAQFTITRSAKTERPNPKK